MKILNLIIASTNEPYYPGLIEQWSRYMNKHPTIISWFIRNDVSLQEPYRFSPYENTLWIKDIENGFKIYDKTAKALQICLSTPGYESITHVIRTNLSSFYIWDRVIATLNEAPLMHYITSRIIVQDSDKIPYPSGCGMIMSRDVAELWANNTNTPERNYLSDDWAFGYTLMRHNISIQPALCYMISDDSRIQTFREYILDELSMHSEYYHLRVKAGTEHHRKTYEVANYKFLVDNFYKD
jgi:hypothetical protein